MADVRVVYERSGGLDPRGEPYGGERVGVQIDNRVLFLGAHGWGFGDTQPWNADVALAEEIVAAVTAYRAAHPENA